MFELPPRPLRRGGFVWGPGLSPPRRFAPAGCETGHDIEAKAPPAPRLNRISREPGSRAPSQSSLFPFIDGRGGAPVTTRPSALDLDEDDEAAAASDEIDLDALRADVPRDDAIPSRFEVQGGPDFPLDAEGASGIRRLGAAGRLGVFSGTGRSSRSRRRAIFLRGHADVIQTGTEAGRAG